MKMKAIEKARKRLSLAEAHLGGIGDAANFSDFEEAWYQFLVAANSIESVLGFGCRSDNKTRPWFGQKISQRRNDELLSYMHQARNVDEHGIEPTAEHVEGSIGIGANGPLHIRSLVIDENGNIKIDADTSKGDLIINVIHPHVRLIPVVDERYNVTFHPPKEHLGQPLTDNSPFNVARLWLAYLSALVDEAEVKAK